MRRSLLAAALLLLLVLAGACGDSGGDGGPLVLLTHDSFAVSDEVLAAFEEEAGTTVEILRGGDAGAMVNQAILTRDAPLADVMYGVDNTFLSRAVEAGIFEPYTAEGIAAVSPFLRLDPAVTPVAFGDVCLNYDKAALAAAGVAPPASLRDLTEPAYRGMLVVENPATSSPGLAFLLATIDAFPDDAGYPWQQFWADLVANDVQVADGWEDAYYGSFSFSGGDRPIVVSYASSPPAEIVFAEGDPPAAVGTAVITDGCFRQIEFAGVLAGTERPELARELVDFMLSSEFQSDVPLNMFVFPASDDVAIPDVFLDHTVIPTEPRTVPPQLIEANRAAWIEEWTSIVLR